MYVGTAVPLIGNIRAFTVKLLVFTPTLQKSFTVVIMETIEYSGNIVCSYTVLWQLAIEPIIIRLLWQYL